MGWPVAASQSRAVPSSLGVRMILPSGLNTGGIDMAMMRQGRTDGLASGRVPEPHYVVRVVLGPRQHDLSIGLDCNGKMWT